MPPATHTKPKGEEETPMMLQYQSIKNQCADAILFFRMGDFYEMFNEDAKVASGILGITLTSRSKNKSNPIPMCGVPHHAATGYIAKLVQAGKKVAICEQMEDPKEVKGIVKRGVVRVVSPGTVLDEAQLDPKSNQFIASIYFDRDNLGLAVLDVTTGSFRASEFQGQDALTQLTDELEKIGPKEVLVSESTLKEHENRNHPILNANYFLHAHDDWTFSYSEAHRELLEHFQTRSLEGFGCQHFRQAVSAAGALIHYLKQTQKTSLRHINALTPVHVQDYMMLDTTTVKSLELIQVSDGSRKNSLLDCLDYSQTPMGARRIKEWILKPRSDAATIEWRLNLVETFKENLLLRSDARENLRRIRDMERLFGRISLGVASARDLIALKLSIQALPSLHALLKQCPEQHVSGLMKSWDNLEDVFELIDKQITDEPPVNLKDGNLIKPGCSDELDRLKSISLNGKNWIAALEASEKERTRISALKVGFNKIYGYYIEITKKNLDRVPENYIRKQSLVNAERFISPELKEYEVEITGAEEKISVLEQELFQKVRQEVATEGNRIQGMARIISEVDALLAFAETAHRFNYCRPRILPGAELLIEDGRHPLVQQIDPGLPFIPNDTRMDPTDHQIMIITGPNMAGKSTYLRQVAIISLMAQIGSFVPASKVETGIVDRIFSRVGAQDHLLKGQSTFMVEMNETANILNNATPNSLIILDEIGRGTSTFDGISIAWAIVEYLHGTDGEGGAKTLFATHYHELTELALVLPGVKNYNVQVKEWNDDIIFLRKIAPGPADKSYGIQVARLAGLPPTVLKRAFEVLDNLEKSEFDEAGAPKIAHSEQSGPDTGPLQLSMFGETHSPLVQSLEKLDPEELTPRQALDLIFELHRLWQAAKK